MEEKNQMMLVVEASLMAFLSLLSFDAFSSTQLYVYVFNVKNQPYKYFQ